MGEAGDGDPVRSTDRTGESDPATGWKTSDYADDRRASDDADDRQASDSTDATDAADGTDRSTATATGGPWRRPGQAPPAEGSFGWRGWVLVAMIVLSFLVIPWTLVYLPAARGLLAELGLSLRDAYLALPMIPAILLAVVAVWAAVRSRSR